MIKFVLFLLNHIILGLFSANGYAFGGICLQRGRKFTHKPVYEGVGVPEVCPNLLGSCNDKIFVKNGSRRGMTSIKDLRIIYSFHYAQLQMVLCGHRLMGFRGVAMASSL